MMIRGAINRIFAEADEKPTIDTQEPPNRLRLPTVEERVNLYLQAVHGNRDFTSKEYSDARGLILDAMAADIAAKSQVHWPEPPWVRPKPAEGPHPAATLSTVAAPLAQRVDYQRDVQYQTSKVARSAMLSHFEDWSVTSSGRELEATLPLAFIPPRSDAVDPTSPARIRKIAKRSLQICAVAAFAGVVAFSLITVLPTTTSKRVVTAVAPSATPLEAQQPRPEEDPDRLLQLGRRSIAAGDISSARVLLKRAAEAGSAPAALELGGTYDPNVLNLMAASPYSVSTKAAPPGPNLETRTFAVAKPAEPAGTRAPPSVALTYPDMTGASPDIGMARLWYQKAKDLGSPEAQARLQRLAGQ